MGDARANTGGSVTEEEAAKRRNPARFSLRCCGRRYFPLTGLRRDRTLADETLRSTKQDVRHRRANGV